jgi:[citrate (pro-3S)-lyase] ligase
LNFKSYYKKNIERKKIDHWNLLIQKELNKHSIDNHQISILKHTNDYVKNKGASLVIIERPEFPDSKYSFQEICILLKVFFNRFTKLLYDFKLINKKVLTRITFGYTKSKITGSPNKLRKNYMVNEDFVSDNVVIKNGYRINKLTSQKSSTNKIYIFGSSLVFSISCFDCQTLPYFIATKFNNNEYQTVNRGVASSDLMNSCFAILDSQISKGDIVILYGLYPLTIKEKKSLQKKQHFLDLTNLFKRPHNHRNVFIDKVHLTPEGNKIVAEKITEHLHRKSDTNYLASKDDKEIFNKVNYCRYKAATKYVDLGFPKYLKKLKTKFKPGDNGIAVMNCNPFTLGHKYLVSTAASKVDNLYLFVVEEDKSHFKYLQRLEMIKNGVKEISNVTIVSTGKYLVSSMTFPDYFYKEVSYNHNMDVTYDFEIFINYIASVLNLKTRFIGNEPFCKTTNNHHQVMKQLLPENGISVVEIKRLENEFGPISASKVRDLIKKKEYKGLKSYLPKTTIDYLTKNNFLI